jgi:hypothetical protein
MLTQHGLDRSEPDVLIGAGARIEGWSCLVGLVGDGQEIHGGEESGLTQWRSAIASSDADWTVHCAPRVAENFQGLSVTTHLDLDLTVSLRSRRAERLHLWVSHLLGEQPEVAAEIAREMESQDYPLRLFRDLQVAADYARSRYFDEPMPLYGLLASSHAKNLASIGVDNTWNATRRVRIERWFNDPPDSERSACQLADPATEFMCQGLELDLPIVCWGSDMVWQSGGWRYTPVRRRHPLRDPEQIVRNTYRVLLTRGRDGLAVFVPKGEAFDETADALTASGVTAVKPADV